MKGSLKTENEGERKRQKTYRMEKRERKQGRLQAFVIRTKRGTVITQQHNMQHSAAFIKLNTGSKRC